MALVLIITSILLLALFGVLHYNQHFKFLRGQIQSQNQQRVCCCGLFISLESEHNLYPQLFIYYILFVICLSIIITVKSIIKNAMDDTLDWLIVFGVLICCLTESFFSFYQFIKITTPPSKVQITSFKHIFIGFFYTFFFSLFYVIQQTHFVYWLWPILSFLHFAFNIVCTFKSSSHLILKYKSLNYANILSAVYLMRRSLIVCTLFQTLYLSLFVGLNQNYEKISIFDEYLPIFWCMSVVLLGINFIKNRQYFEEQMNKIGQWCKHNKIAQIRQEKKAKKILDQQSFISIIHREYGLHLDAQQRMEKVIAMEQESKEKEVEKIEVERKKSPQSELYGQSKYKAFDVLGLSPTVSNKMNKKKNVSVIRSNSFSLRRKVSYVEMNEEEKLDIGTDGDKFKFSLLHPMESIDAFRSRKQRKKRPFLKHSISVPVLPNHSKGDLLRHEHMLSNPMLQKSVDLMDLSPQSGITNGDGDNEEKYVINEEQNEEEDVDYGVHKFEDEYDLDIDEDEENRNGNGDDEVITSPSDEIMSSLQSLLSLGFADQKSVSDVTQLALYQEQNEEPQIPMSCP